MKLLIAATAVVLIGCGGKSDASKERDAAANMMERLLASKSCVEVADIRDEALDMSWLATDMEAEFLLAMIADQAGERGQAMGCRNLVIKED